MDVLERNNVRTYGRPSARPMLFAHGFGCDQQLWRFVAPEFAEEFHVVLFDHVGSGGSDLGAYSPERYADLHAYAADILALVEAMDLRQTVFVGHSVAAMMGVLAAAEAPERFAALVLVGPSPCYLDSPGYRGGFGAADIEDMLTALEENYLGWSSAMAPRIMGTPDRPELGEELTASFCRTDPEIARNFARVTFLSDNRADLSRVDLPTLILQCREDVIAPLEVAEYVAAEIPMSELVMLEATGHCPQVSAREATTASIRAFLAAHGL